jgi:hypothetical protein
MEYTGNKPGPLRREASDKHPEIWHRLQHYSITAYQPIRH